MELKLVREKIFSPENLYENYIEDKIEHEMVLPDYISSAQKVIHCSTKVQVLNKSVSEDKIILEGICSWKILYVSEEDTLIHTHGCEEAFCEQFAIPKVSGNLRYKIKAKNAVCKLHSPQRATCRATVCIAVCLTEDASSEVLVGCENSALQLKKQEHSVLMPCGCLERELKVAGEIALHSKKEISPHSVCSDLVIKEKRVFEGKLTIKGICRCTVITVSKEECYAESVETETPFIQNYEIENLKETDVVGVTVEHTECEVALQERADGNLLITTVGAQLSVCVFRKTELCTVTDAYYPRHETKTEYATAPFYSTVFSTELPVHCAQTVHMNTTDIKILYAERAGEIDKITVRDDVLVIDGKICVSFVSKIGEEIVRNTFSLPFQTTKKYESAFDRIKCDADISIGNFGYLIISDSEIEINCECQISLNGYIINRIKAVSDVTVNAEESECKLKTPLVLYYATAGEKLWDIAKEYSVPLECVTENCDTAGETLKENQLIFITKH